jgi:rifampicin phosphotransferase
MRSNKTQTNEKVIPLSRYVSDFHSGGGKADGLKKIADCQLAVPQTWVIADAHQYDSHDFIQDVLPPDKVFAVRSSAIGEDGVVSSFAGMFTTVLEVPHHEVPRAVRDVVDSLKTDQTLQYQQLRDQQILRMSVVVQEMIFSDFAGVLFTRSPIDLADDVFLVEIVRGLGEQLVSGKVTPLSIRINIRTGMSRVIQPGAQGIDFSECQFIDELTEGAQKLRSATKEELDIEWCVKNGKLIYLQARPITTTYQ